MAQREYWQKCKPTGCKRHKTHKKILGVWYGVYYSSVPDTHPNYNDPNYKKKGKKK
jgi:hypothetical protein